MQLAEELLRQAQARGISPECVLFDSWYAASSLLELIDGFGWHYMAATKRNRLFDVVKIGKVFRHRFGHAVGSLRRLNHRILLVKDGQKFLLTNDVSLTSRAVKRFYRFGQQVEETFPRRLLHLGGAAAAFRLSRARVGKYESQRSRLSDHYEKLKCRAEDLKLPLNRRI